MTTFYSPLEFYDLIGAEAFRQALLDPAMLEPGSVGTNLIFNPNTVNIVAGGDAAMVGSLDQIVLPLQKSFITIGVPYGTTCGYAGDTYKDDDLMMPFTVWTMTQATQDDFRKRLDFVRGNRTNVFEKYNLRIQNGKLQVQPRPNSPITGLVVIDYRWPFRYCRGDENIGLQPVDSPYSGPTVEPAGSVTFQLVSRIALSGESAVTILEDGTLTYADASTIANVNDPVLLTLNSSQAGQEVLVLQYGTYANSGWNWIPDARIYLGFNGAITQTVPTHANGFAFSLDLGVATSPTQIYFDPQVPIVLTA